MCVVDLRLVFLRKDVDKFNEVLKDRVRNGVFWTYDRGDEVRADVTIEDAAFGWGLEIQELAKAGLSFLAYHGCAEGCDAMVAVCYKGEFVECPALKPSRPVIEIGPHGYHDPDFGTCVYFWSVLEKFKDKYCRLTLEGVNE